MTLKHMGWDEQDDYVILDDDRRSVGRIYKRPHLAKVDLVREHLALPPPPPNNGLAPTLEEAKEQSKARYLEMKAAGVRPFA
jgi:hypothetical protein